MKRAILPSFLALVACTPTVKIYSPDAPVTDILEAGEVAEILDVRIELVEAPGRGVIELNHGGTRWDEVRQKQLCGEALEKFLDADSVIDALENGVVDCQPKAWSCASVTFITHELGHVLGLPHVAQCEKGEDEEKCPSTGAKGNVMQPAPRRSKHLTRKQKRIVRLHGHGLEQVCVPTGEPAPQVDPPPPPQEKE